MFPNNNIILTEKKQEKKKNKKLSDIRSDYYIKDNDIGDYTELEFADEGVALEDIVIKKESYIVIGSYEIRYLKKVKVC